MNNTRITLNTLTVTERIAVLTMSCKTTKSKERLCHEYGMTERNISRYVRCNQLIPPLKEMLDEETMTLIAGVEISHLSVKAQKLVYEVSSTNCIRLTMSNAKALREANNAAPLTRKTVQRILGVDRPIEHTSHKGPVAVNLPESIYNRYFSDRSRQDVQTIMAAALEEYFKKGA